MVVAGVDVFSRVEAVAALTDYDVARLDFLTCALRASEDLRGERCGVMGPHHPIS